MPESRSRLRNLRDLFDADPVRASTLGVVATFAVIGMIGGITWGAYRSIGETFAEQLELQRLSTEISRLHEQLASTARLAAVTGDLRFENRHMEMSKELDAVVAEMNDAVRAITPPGIDPPTVDRDLTKTEVAALELTVQGHLDAARRVLFDDDYDVMRFRYGELIRAVSNSAREQLELRGKRSDRRVAVAVIVAIAGVSLLLLIWIALIGAIRRSLLRHARAEEERRALEAQIQYAQRLESLSVLAGGIAHDFNNLLTAILSNAGTARRKLAASHPAQRQLGEIAQGSKMAALLTGQLLAYAGKGQFQVIARDLSAEVREIEDLLETSVRRKARLHFELADGLPAILADPTQIQQVLMNLVLNASESIGTEVDVRIRTFAMELTAADQSQLVPGSQLEPGPCVALEVEDFGWGMDEDKLARIFDPFFTTKSGGRGLGLAASLGIVHRHGGGFQVESSLGHGTCFRVIFPASDQPVVADTSPSVTDLSGRGVILIVDDDEYILQALHVSLEGYGYSALLANDGRRALEIFQERGDDIDLVLLDMSMPGMSGEETYRALREIEPSVKVLLSTGYAPDEAARRFTEEGLSGFLRKPYDPDELAAEVKRIVERDSARPMARMHDALHDLRISYRAKLPEQLDELEQTLAAAREPEGGRALEAARALVHRLSGTAGSYGFEDVHQALDRADQTLRRILGEGATPDRWNDVDAALVQAREALNRD